MSLTKADERWLACLDRAIRVQAMGIPGSGAWTVEELTARFYEAMKQATR